MLKPSTIAGAKFLFALEFLKDAYRAWLLSFVGSATSLNESTVPIFLLGSYTPFFSKLSEVPSYTATSSLARTGILSYLVVRVVSYQPRNEPLNFSGTAEPGCAVTVVTSPLS